MEEAEAATRPPGNFSLGDKVERNAEFLIKKYIKNVVPTPLEPAATPEVYKKEMGYLQPATQVAHSFQNALTPKNLLYIRVKSNMNRA